jgi:sigma54-dependent transcription regulator
MGNGLIGRVDVLAVFDEMMKLTEQWQVKAARGPLEAFLGSTSRMNKMLDELVLSNHVFTSLSWGSMSIILKVRRDITWQSVIST